MKATPHIVAVRATEAAQLARANAIMALIVAPIALAIVVFASWFFIEPRWNDFLLDRSETLHVKGKLIAVKTVADDGSLGFLGEGVQYPPIRVVDYTVSGVSHVLGYVDTASCSNARRSTRGGLAYIEHAESLRDEHPRPLEFGCRRVDVSDAASLHRSLAAQVGDEVPLDVSAEHPALVRIAGMTWTQRDGLFPTVIKLALVLGGLIFTIAALVSARRGLRRRST